MATIVTLERITAFKLAELLRDPTESPTSASSIAIVDVRDDDHIGGHISNSLHVPSASLNDRTISELLLKLADKETVVFHCALSQQRGPAAALKYLRAKTKEEEKNGEKEKAQKVYVLDRGFAGWQEQYGTDPALTEGYRKELWKEMDF